MIRLGGYHGPDLSIDRQVVDLRRRLFEYLRRPVEERAQRRAPIDDEFFFQERIREPVSKRAFGKCVFCEAPADGDVSVDHFRPTSDARDEGGESFDDYYAWLAYEPDNLILACRECAHRKGSYFPVLEERAPYIAPLAEVRRLESPMLVDPYLDHPDRHFDFLVHGKCVPLTAEGVTTVSILGLDRDRLVGQRKDALAGFLHQLRSSLDDRPQDDYNALFDPRAPFMGARLNVLKRLLEGITFRGSRITGPVASLPGRLQRVRPSLTAADHHRIQARIETFLEEDREREQDLSDLAAPRRLYPESVRDVVRAPVRPPSPGGVATISLREFKGVESLDLSIPPRQRSRAAPCLMLLGENSAGKSSILQAIALGVIGGAQARRLKVSPEDILRNRSGDRWDQLAPEDADVAIAFQFGSNVARFVIDAGRRRIVTNGPPAAIVLGYGPRRFFDRRKSGRPDDAHRRVKTLFDVTATIPYPGTWLNQLAGRDFEQVAQVLRIVLSLEDDDELVRDLDQRICVRIRGKTVPVEWLSEGYRSIFVMVVDIVRELTPHYKNLLDAEAIVLIDEIETHLHPRWKMQMMSSLRRALPNVQFIVTTHDPLCLRGMDDGEIVVLQKEHDGRVVALMDLPSVKGMRADQLLTSDYFGLSSTVDPQTEIDMARYVEAGGRPPIGDAAEADDLVRRLTIGDDAKEQVIQEALRLFIDERERPTGKLRPDVRKEAVNAVLQALLDDSADDAPTPARR